MAHGYDYTMPIVISEDDIAFNLANFLHENTGSIFGKWTGKMKANDQRKLAFRNFANRQSIYLNGATEEIICFYQVCFGNDWAHSINTNWAKFERGENF